MHLAVAVGDMDVPDYPLEHPDVPEGRARQLEVRDVGVGLHDGMVDLADQAREGVDAPGDRVLERLELDHELDAARLRVVGELTDVLDDEPEDLVGRVHLEIAVVLARYEQQVAAAEEHLLVDVGPAPVERETPDGGNEVDEPERDADGRPHGQPNLRARVLDRLLLVARDHERIFEDVVRVEPELLRLADSLDDGEPGAVPRRADQAELDHVATCSERGAAPSACAEGRKSSVSNRLRSPRWTPTKYSIALPSSM